MGLTFTLAFRYLVGKKNTNAINIITWVSIIGMSVGTAALILILSVFNGFESLLSGMLSNFNPDLKISLVEGKYADKDSVNIQKIKEIKGIAAISFAIEETAFFDYKGSQEVGMLKGVDLTFLKVTGLDTALISGKSKLGEKTEYGILGSGMNTKLAVNHMDGFTPITAYVPNIKARGPLSKEFNALSFYPSGTFAVGSDIDMQYVILNYEAVNAVLNLENKFTSLEIKLEDKSYEKAVISSLQSILGDKFYIKNRYKQDESFLKIMNIEKWISYLIACLTLIIIAFNLVGSLWMIVLEKKKDIAILKSLGLTTNAIQKVFLLLGLLITFIGMMMGFGMGLVLYYLQKEYGLISIPDGFLIDAYPIELRSIDFILVMLTVMVIGYLASLLPSYRARKVSSFVRQE